MFHAADRGYPYLLNANPISQTRWIGMDPIHGIRSCDRGNAADRDEPYPRQLSNEPKMSPIGYDLDKIFTDH